MKLKQILKALEKDYGWSFYDENKVLHLEEMQKRLILDVAEVAKNIASKPVVSKSVCQRCGDDNSSEGYLCNRCFDDINN